MSFLSSLFIILLCLSIQLCSARNFEVFFHKNAALQIPFSSKDSAEEWKTDSDSILRESHTGTIPLEAKAGEHVGKEGSRRQLRSILEHASVDETMDVHNNDPQDVIDYDPIGAAPPIHNDQI